MCAGWFEQQESEQKETMKIPGVLALVFAALPAVAESYMPLMVTTNGAVAAPLEFWQASPMVKSVDGRATNLMVRTLTASQVVFNDLKLTNNAGGGRLLRSDNTGAASWWEPDFVTLSDVSDWCASRYSPQETVGVTNFQQRLIEWAASEAYQPRILQFDTDGCLVSATVVWPDGSSGSFTRVEKDPTWLTVNAYEVSHIQSGLKVVQPSVLRDVNMGCVTNKPALLVGTVN
jgi:hypothetical protein